MSKIVKTVVDLYQNSGDPVDSSGDEIPDGTCVRTNAVESVAFMEEFATVLAKHMRVKDDFVPYLKAWLEQSFDINCKLRGYKTEQVSEQRILWSGHFSPWESYRVAGDGDSSMDVSTATDNDVLDKVAAFKKKCDEANEEDRQNGRYDSPKWAEAKQMVEYDPVLALLVESIDGFQVGLSNVTASVTG